jgi:L-rhamnonate dehydratase
VATICKLRVCLIRKPVFDQDASPFRGWKNPSLSGAMRSRREAIAPCEWLADYWLGWVDDFIHPERFDEYAAVRAVNPTPVSAGEQVATLWEFERFIRSGSVDVIQQDLSRCGGLTVARQVTLIAQEEGVDLVAHSWLTHLPTGYSLQLIASLPRARFVEFDVSQSSLTRGVCAGAPFALDENGAVRIPDAVGIGVDIDADFTRARRVN